MKFIIWDDNDQILWLVCIINQNNFKTKTITMAGEFIVPAFEGVTEQEVVSQLNQWAVKFGLNMNEARESYI